jgi:hypothetical protein
MSEGWIGAVLTELKPVLMHFWMPHGWQESISMSSYVRKHKSASGMLKACG